jgi:hypothetical protein
VQHLGARVADLEADGFGAERRVDADRHAAEAQRGEVGLEPPRMRPAEDGHAAELAGVHVTPDANTWGVLVYYCTLLSGAAGSIMVAFGSVCLFFRRLCSNIHGKYTTPQEYFNLIFIFIVVVSGFVVWSGDIGFNYGREIMKGLLTFSPINADSALTVHILLLGALLIYIPQTKMGHYVGKYFSYHKILWDNEPNLKNSQMEDRVKADRVKAASYNGPKLSWSAPHINPDASKAKNK